MGLVFAATKVRAMEKELLYREFQTMLGQDKATVLAGLKGKGLIDNERKDISELEASINLTTTRRALYILELCPSPAREFLLEYYLPWRVDFYNISACISSLEAGKSETTYATFEGCEEAKNISEFFELNLNTKLGEVFYELGRRKAAAAELKELAYALLGRRMVARMKEEQDSSIMEAWGLISKEMDIADIIFTARCKAAGKEVEEAFLLGAGGLVSREDMRWLAKSPDLEAFEKRLGTLTNLDIERTGTYLREMYEAAMAGEGMGVVLGFANLSLMDAHLARGLLLGKAYGIDTKAIEGAGMT